MIAALSFAEMMKTDIKRESSEACELPVSQNRIKNVQNRGDALSGIGFGGGTLASHVRWQEPVSPAARMVDLYSCQILTLHDDAFGAKCAREIYHSLIRNLGAEFELQYLAWNIHLLRGEEFEALAVEEAAQADIIFFSIRDQSSVTDRFTDWVENWFARPDRQTAALVLLLDVQDEPHLGCESVREWFKDIAQRGNMKFLSKEL